MKLIFYNSHLRSSILHKWYVSKIFDNKISICISDIDYAGDNKYLKWLENSINDDKNIKKSYQLLFIIKWQRLIISIFFYQQANLNATVFFHFFLIKYILQIDLM